MAKVLICEDSLTDRKIIASALEALGHFCVHCSDGKTAWKILQDNPDIALVITDILMPEMDGGQLIRAMRAHEQLARTPVIIISGVLRLDEIDHLLQLGASRFLPKPISSSELSEYAGRILGHL